MIEKQTPRFDFVEYLGRLKQISPGHVQNYENDADLHRQEFLNKITTLFGFIGLGLITEDEQIKQVIAIIDEKHEGEFVELRRELMKNFAERIPQLERILKEEESENNND